MPGAPWRTWLGSRIRGLRRASPSRKVLVIGCGIIVLMVVMTTGVAFRRYNAELTEAARELRTIDLLLAEEAGRSLQSVELVLDNVADQVRAEDISSSAAFVEHESTKAMYDVLQARVAGVPQLDAVTMISAEGKLINFSRHWPIPDLDLRDRDYFVYLRDHATDKAFLSEPVINRGSGTPTIYLARRISAPDGSFLGLVLGAIELGYFDRLYASLHLDDGNFIALWRQDGVLLARFPPATLGQRISPASITPKSTSWAGVEGVFVKNWTIDGGPPELRVVAAKAVAGFPLQVNIGRSKALILGDWRREVLAIGSAVGFAVLCVALLMWALLRRFHAYEVVTVAFRERERAVVARQEAEDALRQAQKMDAVGQLTGGVAHDFNNLLTVIRGSVDLLRRPQLSDERRMRYIGAISDATDRAAKLTAQLLAFARRQALKPEVFDVVGNVAAVSELIDRLTGSRVQIKTRLPDAPCHVEADASQFDTSIVNMALNGRDAMEQGGRLTIAVASVDAIPAVRSHPALPGPFVAVSVSDTGKGIAPEMLDRVFEPFFTTKKVGEGTGLGLSQVFGFAKQSGGEIQVESRPGEGTTFTLYLPRATADRIKEKPATPAAAEVGPKGTRILVVEDNEQVAGSVIQTLGELGYETVLATSGEQALVELASPARRFDIVFTDVMMPGMSGIELGETIRKTFADLPVVLTSGYSHDLATPGSHDFPLLQKPYTIEDLSRALQAAAGSGGSVMSGKA